MKTIVICALVFIALASGQDEINAESNSDSKLDNENPLYSITRVRRLETVVEAAGTNTPSKNQPSERVERDLDSPFACEPNETYMNDCNYCTCSPDGRSAVCTLMGCLSDDMLEATTTPSPDGCIIE